MGGATATHYPWTGADRPGQRAPRLPARCGLLLVYLLRPPGSVPPTCVACLLKMFRERGAPSAAFWSSPWASIVHYPGARPCATSRPWARASLSRSTWEKVVAHRGGDPCLARQALGAGPDRRVWPIPAMSPVSYPGLRVPVSLSASIAAPPMLLLLRLVRRFPPTPRRRCSATRPTCPVGDLVGRRLPHHLGVERAPSPALRACALDDPRRAYRGAESQKMANVPDYAEKMSSLPMRIGRRRTGPPTERSRWRSATWSCKEDFDRSCCSTSSPSTKRQIYTDLALPLWRSSLDRARRRGRRRRDDWIPAGKQTSSPATSTSPSTSDKLVDHAGSRPCSGGTDLTRW